LNFVYLQYEKIQATQRLWFLGSRHPFKQTQPIGRSLREVKKGVDFELFKNLREEKLSKLPKGYGGRPPYDYILQFKILILQRYYNLSDEQVEYHINDRMSFMRILPTVEFRKKQLYRKRGWSTEYARKG